MSILCPFYALKILNEINFLIIKRFVMYLSIFLRQKATYSFPKDLTRRKMNQTLIVLSTKLNLHIMTLSTTTHNKNMKSKTV